MSNKKILIIEDDPDVRLGYKILLTAHHYDTFFAGDAIAAISDALIHQPDLILLDLGLPEGDGLIVLERLRKRFRTVNLALIPVIVVSAREGRENRLRALKAGARAYIQKPWNDNELLALIKQLLSQSDPLESSPT